MPPSSSPTLTRRPSPAARRRDPSDPVWKSVELAQRARMVLDVAAADLEVAEARLGPFHETAWYFRNALAEARRSWDRLRATYGGPALESALAEPPVTLLTLGDGQGLPALVLVPIGGRTYRAERVEPTPLAPKLWRLTRLAASEDGPYYAGRLRDGSTRCDCAEWTYQVLDVADAPPCKHLAALAALGWI